MNPHKMPPELRRWTADQLAGLGYRQDFRSEPLVAEASNRHFYRIHARGRATFVVMNSPPDKENNDQFLAMAEVFAASGVGVPRIIARASDPGYFLLTDLGEQHFADVYESDQCDAALAAGIDTLIRIQSIDDPAVPRYEGQRFRDELGIFREWFVEGWLAQTFPHADLDDIFEHLVTNTQDQLQCCVHRDFHCRNLLFNANTNGSQPAGQIGVVDFQDALIGPVSYDLASLLRDCYYRFTEPQIARWRSHYLHKTPYALDAAEFEVHLDLTAVQRQLKAVGIFARLQIRDRKSSHLQHILPVLRHLQALTARYPELAALHIHLNGWCGAAASRTAAVQ